MLSVAEASARILEGIAPLQPERASLETALGRVLATTVISPITLPPWDNSAMDGYAVRTESVAGASKDSPVRLPVRETVAAGQFASGPLGSAEAVRVMTGAPVPVGTEGVIRVEDTDGGVREVLIRDARDAGRNLRSRGEDLHAGDIVLERGMPLGAAQIGVLASVGAAAVDVFRRPRVAILGSGDELVDLDRFREVVAGRKIVSSNGYTLDALVRLAGGVPVQLGTASDSAASIAEGLRRAAGCDLIITSAGISVGEFDYTREALVALGAEMKFWKVRMRPGAPLGFGLLQGVPWIGLPGNPVSAMVTFELFARPVVRRMLGHVRLFRRPVSVVLEEPVRTGVRLTHFLRAIVRVGDDATLTARLTGPQGSGILTSMSRANALLVVPEDRQQAEAGETMHALMIGEDAGMAEQFAL